MSDTYYRSRLCHTIPGNERQLKPFHKQFLEMLRNGGTSRREHLDMSTKSLIENNPESIAEIRIVLVVFKFGRAALAMNELSESIFNKLGQHQWHGKENSWLILTQRRLEIGRNRRKSKNHKMHSIA